MDLLGFDLNINTTWDARIKQDNTTHDQDDKIVRVETNSTLSLFIVIIKQALAHLHIIMTHALCLPFLLSHMHILQHIFP